MRKSATREKQAPATGTLATRRLIALLSLLLNPGCGSEAPSPAYTCSDCTIRTELITTLDPPSVELEPPLSSRVLRIGDGRYLVVPIGERGAVTAYDSTGRFLQRVGQRGMGPGEFFRLEDAVVGPGDSIFVFHDARLAVLTPQFGPVRSFSPGTVATGRAAMVDSTILVGLNGVPGPRTVEVAWLQPSDGSPAAPLSVVDRAAIESLGLVRVDADSNSFLLFLAGKYLKINTLGVVLDESRMSPPWFDREIERSAEEQRREPHIGDIAIGRGDTVWAIYRRYERLSLPPSPAGEEAGPRQLDLNEFRAYARAMVEVFDSRSDEPIFGDELGLVLGGFIDQETLYAFEQAPDGTVRIAIHRYWLEAPVEAARN